jgi:rod shape determining protein RodA
MRLVESLAPLRAVDPLVVGASLALTGIGMVAIYSAKLTTLTALGLPANYFLQRQMIAGGLGLVLMIAATVFDYRRLRSFIPFAYLGTLLLLVVVLTPLGTSVRGSQRWVALLGFQIQPSELMKITLLLALAMLFNETEGVPGLGRSLVAVVLAVVPLGRVVAQPNLGT